MHEPLFRAWDFFLVRAPLGAVSPNAATPVLVGDPDDGAPGYLALIRTLTADQDLTEAVTLATPPLSRALARAQAGAGLKETQLRRAALALLRYHIRRHTRPTPFGLFAGVCHGNFGDTAKVETDSRHRTCTRVDTDWLLRIIHRLEEDRSLVALLPVRAHQCLIARNGRLILQTPNQPTPGPSQDSFSAVSVRHTPAVAEAIRNAGTPIVFAELAGLLARRFPTAGRQRITQLLLALVQHGLLITSLHPPLDGTDPLTHVLDVVATVTRGNSTTRALTRELHAIDRLRQTYDTLPPGQGLHTLTELTQRATRLQPHDRPLRADTVLGLNVQLTREVRREVERAAEVLWRLAPATPGTPALRGMHSRFLDRYGTSRLVPVLELLDETTGLGPPPGYAWPASESAPAHAAELPDDARDRLLGRLLGQVLREHRREVVLGEPTLQALAGEPRELPGPVNSGELYVHVVSPSLDQLSAGTFQVFPAPGPVSYHAGATLARFAELAPAWRDQLAREQGRRPLHTPDALPADLVFAPRAPQAANVANVMPGTGRRITAGLTTSDRAEEIPLAELAIGADTGRLYAIHLPTGREIVPVMPSMVNAATHAPNAIRLLSEIGLEGQRLWRPWSWGPLSCSPFLPRVRYGRVILFPATWRLDPLREITTVSGWAAALTRWRQDWAVPQHVLLASADQRLLLDLASPWHRELMRDELCKDSSLTAVEVPGESEGWTATGTGHTIELVVPFTRRAERPHCAPPQASLDPARSRRGAARSGKDRHWLYYRVHCAHAIQDDVLRQHLPPLVDAARVQGIGTWFFVRYTDADGHHLRLRFAGPPTSIWPHAAPALNAMLETWQQQGIAGPYRIEQYDPELERYGGTVLQPLAELTFQHDSAAAVTLLQLAADPQFPYSSDALSAVSIAALAHAFGHPSAGNADGGDEHPGEAAAAWLAMTGGRRELPGQYRARRPYWRALIDPAGNWPALRESRYGQQVLAALKDRDNAAREYGRALRAVNPGCERQVVSSLAHMAFNRLAGGPAEQERLVLGIARGAVVDNWRRRMHTR
jgi:class I lanthipeptide synthase